MLFISCPIKVTLRSNLCVHDSKVGKFKNGKDGNKYQSAQTCRKNREGVDYSFLGENGKYLCSLIVWKIHTKSVWITTEHSSIRRYML